MGVTFKTILHVYKITNIDINFKEKYEGKNVFEMGKCICKMYLQI